MFSIVTEGPLYHVMNGWWDHPDAIKLYDEFGELLERYGLYWEMGRAVDIHIHPINRDKYYDTWLKPHLR